MTIIELPRLIAGRDLADGLMDRAGDVTGQDVVLDARGLVSATASFSAQLVNRALVEGGAHRLVVAGGPEHFAGFVTDAAASLGVAERVEIRADLPVAA